MYLMPDPWSGRVQALLQPRWRLVQQSGVRQGQRRGRLAPGSQDPGRELDLKVVVGTAGAAREERGDAHGPRDDLHDHRPLPGHGRTAVPQPLRPLFGRGLQRQPRLRRLL